MTRARHGTGNTDARRLVPHGTETLTMNETTVSAIGQATRKTRILSLDGGGAKGVYTLGVLKEVEAAAGQPLHQLFSFIYGTSTGAIIAALLGLGHSTDEILELYMKHVPAIMKQRK